MDRSALDLPRTARVTFKVRQPRGTEQRVIGTLKRDAYPEEVTWRRF